MRIEHLTPDQLARLRAAKEEVIRHGLLHRTCTDQRFLSAVAVKRRNPIVFETLSGALPESGRLAIAFEIISRLADELEKDDGVWDQDGWRPS